MHSQARLQKAELHEDISQKSMVPQEPGRLRWRECPLVHTARVQSDTVHRLNVARNALRFGKVVWIGMFLPLP